MKKIPLTQGQEAIVDDWWFDYLMQWKWRAQWNAGTESFYAVRGANIRMHRVIMKTPKGMICDHIHHDTLDNREKELRNVTMSQSMMNKRVRKNSRTGIIGVTIFYHATLSFEGKRVLDSKFRNLDDAIKARLEAEKKYFGEYMYKKK